MPLGLIGDSIHLESIHSNQLNWMTYTTIPSVKGQITIPAAIRKKYQISQATPVVIQDDHGIITIKVMRMVEQDDMEYREDKTGFGITFKKGISPQKIVDAIKKCS